MTVWVCISHKYNGSSYDNNNPTHVGYIRYKVNRLSSDLLLVLSLDPCSQEKVAINISAHNFQGVPHRFILSVCPSVCTFSVWKSCVPTGLFSWSNFVHACTEKQNSAAKCHGFWLTASLITDLFAFYCNSLLELVFKCYRRVSENYDFENTLRILWLIMWNNPLI